MAKGSLTIEVTDARGGAVSGELHIELDPQPRSIGGDPMEVTFNVRGHKSFEISNISCHDGPGTLYTAITRLVERKLIAPETSSGRQRPYRITAQGSKTLAAQLSDMRRVASIGLARLRTA